ncbi:hypothetical protein DAPPUDRAFT_239158 [Daphnia pulex]|uniref:Uncharacterized protein n=1 Tax=Daphnia pulex TaxID=6669 RepID=E9G8H8_DAPPU|nr:hypothetical protein DAPPUDRAFT_239158 [Daphnia pulex]|eukprot:EFX83977.1 hypothetical protein DAPPUDRAFT_239158 [Daphnia pulex]
MAFPTRQQLPCTICHQLPSSSYKGKLWRRIKYYTNEASKYYTTIYAASRCITKEPEPIPGNVNLQMGRRLRAVLLFGVVSLMVGSTTGVPMSPGYGGYQATAAKEYYTTSPPYYNRTTSPSATPPRLKSYATNYAAPSCITKAPEYYITEAPKYYTTEYSVPAYYTAVPKYYTTTNASSAYYTEALTYFNTTAAAKYYVAQAYNTAAAPSYYIEPKYYTEYYTTPKGYN